VVAFMCFEGPGEDDIGWRLYQARLENMLEIVLCLIMYSALSDTTLQKHSFILCICDYVQRLIRRILCILCIRGYVQSLIRRLNLTEAFIHSVHLSDMQRFARPFFQESCMATMHTHTHTHTHTRHAHTHTHNFLHAHKHPCLIAFRCVRRKLHMTRLQSKGTQR